MAHRHEDHPFPRGRRLALSGPEWLGVGMCAAVVSAWICGARGELDFRVALFCTLYCYGCALAGRFCHQALWPRCSGNDFPTTFLFGFFVISGALFFLSLASPLGLPADALLVLVGIIAWGLARGSIPIRASLRDPAVGPGLAATLISLIAATFWSADSILPIEVRHGLVVFKPWSDSFVHACMIRMFRDAHGAASLEHIMLPGAPAQFYHYASYVAPALLASVTRTPCYLALTSFQNPVGIVLTGLAAFALARWWWGPAAGLAATVALLLVPDASAYGIKNPFLGSHWLQQVVPAGSHGVALMAVAWLLLFEGCRSGRLRVVGLSYIAAGFVLLTKSHIFVANAFLLWVAPPLLAPGLRPRRRAAWFTLAVLVFVAVASLARHVPSAPVLRLDGSGLRAYVDQLARNLDEGALKERLSVAPDASGLEVLTKGVVHLLFGTFGVFGLVGLGLVGPVWRRGTGPVRDRVAVALFPVAVVVNYLVMALGLAHNTGSVTAADELIHRPLVWAYFVVASWTGGAVGEVVIRPLIRRFAPLRVLLPVAVLGLLAVPLIYGQGVQVGPGWGRDFTNTTMSVNIYKCAGYMRERGRPAELVLDSGRDPTLALGALSERREFVIDYWDERKRPLLAGRLAEADRLERLAGLDELKRFAAGRGIVWYVLRPTGRVRWPASFLARPAFVSGGDRVYRLDVR